jgi:ankyrin repeat protein
VRELVARCSQEELNARDKDRGWTPLKHACIINAREIANVLLAAGADINLDEPIFAAVFNGFDSITSLLLQHGATADVGKLFIHSIRSGYVETCKALMHRVNLDDYNKAELLLHAIGSLRGETERQMVQWLLENGARGDQASNGVMPLHRATYYGELEIVALLVKHGANVDARQPFKSLTPLYYAAQQNRVAIASFLLSRGANVFKPVHGNTPLSAAQEHGNPMVSLLKRHMTRHHYIVDIVLAMSSLELPAYILLWIMDWLHATDGVSELQTITLIAGVLKSICRVKERHGRGLVDTK